MRRLLIVIYLLISGCAGDSESSVTVTPAPPRILIITPEQYTFGGGTTPDHLIEAAGGVNAAHELNDYSQIADWQVLDMAPDVILFSRTWTMEAIENWSRAAVYANVPAVRSGRLHQLDFSLAETDLLTHADERIATLRELLAR